MTQRSEKGKTMKARTVACWVAVAVVVSLGLGCERSEDRPDVMLDGPPNGAGVGRVVTFSWHITRANEGETYHSFVLTDKGEDPFDGYYEDTFDAGQNTELTVDMPSRGFYGRGTSFQWGVQVVTSAGAQYKSDVWRLTLRF